MIEVPGIGLPPMVPFDSTTPGCSVSLNPDSTTVGMLTTIWESLLHRHSIGIDDNFFSLGGHLEIADLLFAEIAQKMHRQLPSSTILHAQTIRALASVLGQPTLPRFSTFVELKPGTKAPPIFITHGLSGCASFFRLAECIRTEHPIYRIRAKGVDGLEEPFDRIEDMAQFYVDALHQLQPQGPYILVGYSFGGLVALEMAQRLCGAIRARRR